jgi:hypothetical protein
MLTGMVNIAVFAAFHTCVGSPFVLIAEFKGVCGDQPLDVSRYGWQKRQETATIWQGDIAVLQRDGRALASDPSHARMRGGGCGHGGGDMRLERCYAR